jgi:membrane associated rhomboid family serine protease
MPTASASSSSGLKAALSCPRCGSVLAQSLVRGRVVRNCPQGHGHAQSISSLREWIEGEHRFEFGLRLRKGKQGSLPCPRCNKRLLCTKVFGECIEHCAGCELAWLTPSACAKMPLSQGSKRERESPLAPFEGLKWGPYPPFATLAILFLFALVAFVLHGREIPEYFVCMPREPLRYLGFPFLLSIFAHGNFAHLACNLYFLFLAGTALETHLGWKRFLLLFFLSALGAKISQAAHTNMGSLGASGAVSGVLMALAALQPSALYVFRPLFLLQGLPVFSGLAVSIKLPIWLCVVIWSAFDALSLGQFREGAFSQIGHAAHLGGALTGALFIGHSLFGGEKAA